MSLDRPTSPGGAAAAGRSPPVTRPLAAGPSGWALGPVTQPAPSGFRHTAALAAPRPLRGDGGSSADAAAAPAHDVSVQETPRTNNSSIGRATGSRSSRREQEEARHSLFALAPDAFFKCEGRPHMQELILEHEDELVSEVEVEFDGARFPVHWCPRRPSKRGGDPAGNFFVLVGAAPGAGAGGLYVIVLSVFSTGEDERGGALYENSLPMLERYYQWFDHHFLLPRLPPGDSDSSAGIAPELPHTVHTKGGCAELLRCDDAVHFQTVVAPL
eukprot:gene8346-7252_t